MERIQRSDDKDFRDLEKRGFYQVYLRKIPRTDEKWSSNENTRINMTTSYSQLKLIETAKHLFW